MTVSEFLKTFTNSARISIEGYCEENSYEYLALPSWADTIEEFDEECSRIYNRKYDCIFYEKWWDDVKDKEIKEWSVLGGFPGANLEVWIDLKQ